MVKDGVLTLHRIIVIHKNKTKTKHLKTKQKGKTEIVDEVKVIDKEEEREEDNIPLKHKRQCKEDASGLMRVKSTKVKDSKNSSSLASTISSKDQTPTKTFLLLRSTSKTTKGKGFQSSPKIQKPTSTKSKATTPKPASEILSLLPLQGKNPINFLP